MCLRVPKQKRKRSKEFPHVEIPTALIEVPDGICLPWWNEEKNDESAQDGENLTRRESSAAGWVFSHD